MVKSKIAEELFKEDLYELLEINFDADEKKIKKSFRKKALECHPDKNPDNPKAAEQFNKLKTVLEVLLDPGARASYDKTLKARKEAVLRRKAADSKSQKLRKDLEEREKAAQTFKPHLSEEERFRRELKRLEEEGESLIAEELEKLNKEAEESCRKDRRATDNSQSTAGNENRIKAKWKKTDDWEGYTKDEIEQLFYKWGEINAVVMKTKGSKTTALIEFKDANGANLAAQCEKGLIGKPLEVIRCSKPDEDVRSEKFSNKASKDFESVAAMNRRREEERRKLIEQMKKEQL